MPRALTVAAIVMACGSWTSTAHAHIELLRPAARYFADFQKDDPCGHPRNPPGRGEPTVFTVGETITIRFEEFVQHQGHFRVALDPTGTDAFVSPSDFDDLYNSPEVLLDDIPDVQDGGLHTVELTLPDEPCDPCTLQVIQVMTDDGAWGPGNDDLYFQCADIVIQLAAADSGDPDTGDSADDDDGPQPPLGSTGGSSADDSGDTQAEPDGQGESGGCSCREGQGSAVPALWLLGLGLPAWRRRW